MRPELRNDLIRAAAAADTDLAAAALLIARVEYPRLDPAPYLARLDEMGAEARVRLERMERGSGLPSDSHDAARSTEHGPLGTAQEGLPARVAALNAYLFDEEGFAGNREQYHDPRNSCLNEVLERRTGIPITLALVYMEVARRAGIQADGVNFPGHFLMRLRGRRPASDLIVDAYHGGALLSEADCRQLLRRHVGDELAFDRHLLAPATTRQILVRMLLNLKRVYVGLRSFPQARDVTDLLFGLDPSAHGELRDRGLLAYHLDDFPAALRDLERYLRLTSSAETDEPDETDDEQREEHEQIWDHVKALRRRVASLN